ncbi:MAG TPA: N-acetylmuramoyl-L-alanine amidase, partial [Thermoanaerobaculia bacterium]
MRPADMNRVKRRVLQEAVAENLETIRGLPPRAVRPVRRAFRIWMARAPLIVLTLVMAGAALMLARGEQPLPPVPMKILRQAGLPIFRAAEARPETERVAATAFPLAVRRVVLDAGHGGSDPGATAAQLLEKEITLDIGQRLKTRLESDGFEVVATRDGDRTIALKERARLANESRSDIFVSIHVNALLAHTDARGIETYYLGATSDPKLTQLAAAENRVSGYSMSDMRALL